MVKNFFKKISQNFCVYLLTALNLTRAIQTSNYDWLLWVSLALSVASLVLCVILAIKEERSDASA